MLQLTGSNFHSHVEANAMLVVEFSPADDEDHPLSTRFPNAMFARVDPRREPEVAGMFGLKSAPALLIFREGVAMYLEPAHHSPDQIAGLLDRISALDMDKVRAAIEEERAKTAVHMRRMCPAARRGPIDQ